MKTYKLNKKAYLLAGVVLLGLVLRLYGLNYGLPYVVGPDEKRQVLDALSMGARHSLVPIEHTYPALHKYVLLFCFGIYYFVGVIFKDFLGVSDFVFKFLINPGNIFLLARLISVLFGIALVWPVYCLGKHFFSSRIGLISAIFCVSMYTLIAHSQWAMGDILLVFWSTWAFYYILRCVSRGSFRDFLMVGVLIGLASITKYQGVFLIVPFLTGLFLKRSAFEKDKEAKTMVFLTFIIVFGILILGNLGFIFDFKANLLRLMELKDETMGISSLRPFSQNIFGVSAWFIKELIRQELLLGAVLVLGIFYSLYKRSVSDWIFLSYVSVCLFPLVSFGFRFLHLLVCSFAVICVFGARLVDDFSRMILKGKANMYFRLGLVAVIVVPSINTAYIWGRARSYPDTRIIAMDWVRKNIPVGITIAEDWYDLCVPLQNDTPNLFQDDRLKVSYIKYFSPDIRNAYIKYAKRNGTYNLIQARFETENPVWPIDAPEDFLKRAAGIPMVKRLYRWFNFHNIEELREMGASYLIISSYSYNHFLLDDDQNKATGLFTISNTEDTLSSNRQAKQYEPGTRYGLLFYLSKRARDFYSPLLSTNKAGKGVTLVKEIFPSRDNLGPVIRIYQITGPKRELGK